MTKRALIIGGGQLGTAVARELSGVGWNVSLLARSAAPPGEETMPGVSRLTLDRDDAAAMRRAIGGGCDALIDTVSYDGRDSEQLLGFQSDIGHIVALSSASVYADAENRSLDEAAVNGFPDLPAPIGETHGTVLPGPETYSTRKVRMERVLLDGASCPATVLRPCAVYGPLSRAPREWWFVKRLLDGRKRIPLAFSGGSLFHPSAASNVAALSHAVLRCSRSGVFNAVDPACPTVAQIGASIARWVGIDAELVCSAGRPLGSVGRSPWSVPKPYVLSGEAARAIGFSPTVDYADGVKAACDWLVANVPVRNWRERLTGLAGYPYDLFDYEAEDRWFSRSDAMGPG